MKETDLNRAEEVLEQMKGVLETIGGDLDELERRQRELGEALRAIGIPPESDRMNGIFDEYSRQMRFDAERLEEVRTIWLGMIGQIRKTLTLTGKFANKEE